MTDRDSLLRAILTDPHDDLPRLVFADWLEERGEGDRAEFVRAQCDLARLRALGCHEGESCNVTGQCAECGRDVEAEPLRRRERDLFRADDRRTLDWFGLPRPWARVVRLTPFDENRGDDPYAIAHLGDDPYAIARRGFLDELRLPLPAFLAHAGAVFRAHPVTAVRLTCRRPNSPHPDGPFWWQYDPDIGPNNPAWLPPEVFGRLPGEKRAWRTHRFEAGEVVRTRAEADDQLSVASVGLGRTLAGLPPLPGHDSTG